MNKRCLANPLYSLLILPALKAADPFPAPSHRVSHALPSVLPRRGRHGKGGSRKHKIGDDDFRRQMDSLLRLQDFFYASSRSSHWFGEVFHETNQPVR